MTLTLLFWTVYSCVLFWLVSNAQFAIVSYDDRSLRTFLFNLGSSMINLFVFTTGLHDTRRHEEPMRFCPTVTRICPTGKQNIPLVPLKIQNLKHKPPTISQFGNRYNYQFVTFVTLNLQQCFL